MTERELRELIEKSFGLSDEQALEELEAAEREVTQEDRESGDFKALRERLEQLRGGGKAEK